MNVITLEEELGVSEEATIHANAEALVAENVFSALNQVLEANFYKPDLQATRIVLGTINAHYLNIGDPAWLFVVAPPGMGKTTTSIMGACGLPEVISLSEFSENTFLSGFYGHKEPGVLEKVGHVPVKATRLQLAETPSSWRRTSRRSSPCAMRPVP